MKPSGDSPDPTEQVNDEVRLSVTVTPGQARAALLRQPVMRRLCLLLAAVAALYVGRDVVNGDLGGLVAVLVLGVVLGWVLWLSVGRSAARWTRRAEWTISATGVTTTTTDSTATIGWSRFTALEGQTDVMVFRVGGGGLLLLPRTAIAPGDVVRIERWARAAGVTVKGRASVPEGTAGPAQT
jgi:hypothetical protein